MQIESRIAKPSDAPFIALLGRVTFAETFGHLFRDPNDLKAYFERTFTVEKIESGLQQSGNKFWIAFVDQLPVAYAKLKLDSPSEFINIDKVCQLQKIYVLKDFLSLKIGYELQRLLLAEAVVQGFEKIWLSVLIGNDRAINFYKKNKFIEVGNHDFQIGKENFSFLVMAKDLINENEN